MKLRIIQILRFLTPIVWFFHIQLKKVDLVFSSKKMNSWRLVEGSADANFGKKLVVFLAVASRLNKLPCESFFKLFKNHGYDFVVILNGEISDSEVQVFLAENDLKCAFVRSNYGYDFGGYKSFFENFIESRPESFDEIILINDSVYFPATNPSNFFYWLRNSRDFGASIINYGDVEPHAQSFFLQFKGGRAIQTLKDFFKKYTPYNSRVHAINSGEKGLCAFFRERGFELSAFIDIKWVVEANSQDLISNVLKGNMTHNSCKNLILRGYPFLKYDVFSKRINAEDILSVLGTVGDDLTKSKLLKYIDILLYRQPQTLWHKLLSIYGII